MGANSTRSLFLQVGGDISGLRAAARDGKTELLNLVRTANDTADDLQQAFRNMAGDPAAVKQLEASYNQMFANIRRNAQAALAAPNNASAAQVINVAGAQQAASAAELLAVQTRAASDAALQLAERQGAAGVETRTFAAALAAEAGALETNAVALRAQATVAASVAAEMGLLSEEEAEVTGAHGRFNASSLIADHVMRSFADSVAAGQSPVRALAMELPRVG